MRKILFRLVAVLLFSTIFFSCAAKEPRSGQPAIKAPAFTFYYKALASMEQGDYERAIARMDTAIRLKPGFSQFYYVRGQLFELAENTDSALVNYERALTFKSYFPETWQKLADLYLKTGRYDNAINMLKNLSAADSDSLHYGLLLAEAYVKNRQPRLALERLNIFENQGGKSPETARIRGLALYEQGKYAAAAPYLKEYSIKNAPDFWVEKALGIALVNTGNLDAGMSHLNRALSLNPDDAEIYLVRARYFRERSKPQIAGEQLNYALRIDSTNSRVLMENARFYLAESDTARAENFLEKVLLYDSTWWNCYKYLGLIAYSRGKSRKALQYLMKYHDNIYVRDPEVEQRIKALSKSTK